MRNRVERVRIWLVVGAGLLVLVVAGFLGYAKYRSRVFLAGLPGRLGAEITRETSGYTYSQTVQGRTIFTLHAAKAEQRKDGLVKLHDVGVVLYGRRQDRADRIYGKEFEYDPAAGIVRALGEVNLDLQAPAPAAGKKAVAVSAAGAPLAATDAKVVHIKTSGLVYLTKLEVAATAEEVEFSEGTMTGRARGADFNSDTGILILNSAVRVTGLTSSGPMVLTASRAELDRTAQVTNLTAARLVMPDQTVDADWALVHVRKDGSAERIEASGRVVMTRLAGGTVTSGRAELALDAQSKPQQAHLMDRVGFVEDEAARHARGQSAEARIGFDGAGRAEHVTMTGGVEVQERQRAAGATEQWSTRRLTGATVELALAASGDHGAKMEVRDAHATGAARLVVMDEAVANGRGASRTELAGDEMTARLVGGRQVADVVAVGHTVLRRVNALGVEERSEGDRTDLVFRTGKQGGAGLEELASGVQAGHVVTVRRTPPRGPGASPGVGPVEERAVADRSVFDGDANRVTLTGGVVLTNVGSTLWGNRVVVERGSGDAMAEGAVRVTYLDAGGTEPVHILADHAELKRGARGEKGKGGVGDRAFFYGSAARMARMWQGSSQVEAPVLEFEQEAKRLTASGPGAAGMAVRAVLVQAGDAGRGRAGAVKAGGRPQGAAVRIQSREMVYTDAVRQVVFAGGVLVEDADGRMRAQRATVYLQAAGGAKAAAGAGRPGGGAFPAGNVDHIDATGAVAIDQPGRHGTGEELVYTASDGMFVLTGTAAAPPRMEDQARGTVTGGSLRFHAGDDSVVVTSGSIERGTGSSGAGDVGRVRTETRVKR